LKGRKAAVFNFLDPLTQKRIRKFKNIKRSYYSLIILVVFFVMSLAAEIIANDKPLAVQYNGKWFFPIVKVYQGTDFGLDSILEPDYKEIVDHIMKDGTMLTPPVWWGYNESNKQLDSFPAPPGKENWLGTDDRGRDVFVRIIYAFRLSLAFALFTVVASLTIGILVGGVQGFFGGKVDMIGQRGVEIWVALPAIFVVILVVNVLEPSILVLMGIIASFSWAPASYYIRSECLRLKNKDFAVAAKSLGASQFQLFFSHIVPNALTPMVTLAPFIMTGSIFFLSFLDYMGLGVQAPTASLGELLRQGRENFIRAWWLAFYPFIALVGTLMLLNFIGEGVRKAFDPRSGV
jgi:microcin C transport system permease protein